MNFKIRRDEEIVDACFAVCAFLLLFLLCLCAPRWRCIDCCWRKLIDCLCCRKWGPDRVQSYNDLEELLFHVDETTGGRLAGIDEEGGITVCNFFCDVLKQKPKRPTAARLSAEEILQDQNVSRFSEPLL